MGPLPIDVLKYRGVFDYPHNQSSNLLPRTGNSKRDAISKTRKVQRSTSMHVLNFMGWSTPGKPKFTGEPSGASIMAQRAVWAARWTQWSWYEDGEELFEMWFHSDNELERHVWWFRAQSAFTKALDGPRPEVTKLAKAYLKVLTKGDWRAERRQAIKEASLRKKESAQRRASEARPQSEEFEAGAAALSRS